MCGERATCFLPAEVPRGRVMVLVGCQRHPSHALSLLLEVNMRAECRKHAVHAGIVVADDVQRPGRHRDRNCLSRTPSRRHLYTTAVVKQCQREPAKSSLKLHCKFQSKCQICGINDNPHDSCGNIPLYGLWSPNPECLLHTRFRNIGSTRHHTHRRQRAVHIPHSCLMACL